MSKPEPLLIPDYEPSMEEVKAIFKSKHRSDDSFKLQNVRTVLIQIHEDHEVITKLVYQFVGQEERDNVLDRLTQHLPKKESCINAHTNGKDECSQLMTEIYFVMISVMKNKTTERIPHSFRKLMSVIGRA